MKIDKDLKQALCELPTAEKDKLLIRLIKRDKKLIKRFQYELTGDFTKQELQTEFRNKLESIFSDLKSERAGSREISGKLRNLSGEISGYLFTTGDKYGEIELNLYLLNRAVEVFHDELNRYINSVNGDKLLVYLINKVFNLRILLQKLPSDLFMDFEDALNQLFKGFSNNEALMITSTHHGFDLNWIISEKLPENILEIRKDLRARGYLK
ncbi:MAG: hypothetical protein R3277_09205 [Brumimicrobium sp.]|nr:hypothetical protein [Brumimicrobium sp.]